MYTQSYGQFGINNNRIRFVLLVHNLTIHVPFGQIIHKVILILIEESLVISMFPL